MHRSWTVAEAVTGIIGGSGRAFHEIRAPRGGAAVDTWAEGIDHRTAFGLACRLAEARNFDMASGRDGTSPAAGGDVARITAEVLRQMAIAGPCPAAVRAGIADALAGRKPRW